MATWRFLALRPDGDGGEDLITSDLPVTDAEVVVNLSGPANIRITLPIHLHHLVGSDGNPVFAPWGTTLYVERDGKIIAGGIVNETDASGGVLHIQAVGHVGYLQDMPFMGEYGAYDADPLDLARYIWAHVQGQPGSNLGLSVDGLRTNRRIGTKGSPAFRGRPPIKDDFGNIVTPAQAPRAAVDDEPFLLSWYQTSNLLEIFNNLAKVTPFDYAERHAWLGDKIIHHLDLAHPTMGVKRDDLHFVVGENLIVTPKVYQTSASYASEIMLLGSGEGSQKVRAISSQPARSRLRRVAVISDPSIPHVTLAKAMTDNELKYMTGMPSITDMTVVDHPNAPIGTFDVGDMIFVQASNGWFSEADMWVRIASITYSPGQDETAQIVVVHEGE